VITTTTAASAAAEAAYRSAARGDITASSRLPGFRGSRRRACVG
jgi:hypothetical protein